MNSDIWEILHDGLIADIFGNIPGNVEFKIEIEYLRRIFSDDGKCIFLLLKDCSSFKVQSYEMMDTGEKESRDFIDLVKGNSEILRVDAEDEA
ncbi:MAG: hypothetical protein HQL26_09175 [Candidatus Omnitrophica bacterium]|nr:hypothetical protein [Candidatus Omnitrophota bacterium]